MKITSVNVRKIEKEGSRMKGIASVLIDDSFAVHDIRIIEGDNGLFIAMPSRKTQAGGYRDIAHPINPEVRAMFQDKIAVVTGGAKGIGKAIAEEFRKAGAKVCIIDLLDNDGFTGDLAEQTVLENFARKVIAEHGHVDYLINNAIPLMKGIDECSYEEFNYALCVGVTAPFYLTKLFAPHFAPGAAIVNISSSRDRMSQPQTESYTAAKGGIAALTHALAVTLREKARVNSISPKSW